jgi:hypothetical protein
MIFCIVYFLLVLSVHYMITINNTDTHSYSCISIVFCFYFTCRIYTYIYIYTLVFFFRCNIPLFPLFLLCSVYIGFLLLIKINFVELYIREIWINYALEQEQPSFILFAEFLWWSIIHIRQVLRIKMTILTSILLCRNLIQRR